jgi:N-acetyl-alpha-D-muramate 1-phosphate uridylyltransferase
MTMLPVAVLAGGRATRLGAITATVPKALLQVAGRPFIHWQLALLAQQGVSEVVLCLGHLGEQIRAAVGSGAEFGVRVRYSFDGPSPLGTGGALKHALPLLGNAFFVAYGDSYLPCSFPDVQTAFVARGTAALMTVLRNDDRWDTSNVLFGNGKIIEYDKRSPRPPAMVHVDFGLTVLTRKAVESHPAGAAFDLADLYRTLSLRGELAGLEVSERFYEIGSLAGLEATERYLRTLRAEDEPQRTLSAGSC